MPIRTAVALHIRDRVIVIANREPYSHEFDEGGKVVVRQPASGLVTGTGVRRGRKGEPNERPHSWFQVSRRLRDSPARGAHRGE
jgi:hypothetical protein